MNLLDQLLGPAPAGTDPLCRHGMLDGDIPLLFEESITSEDIAIGSRPGRMPPDDWLASLKEPWIVSRPSPIDSQAIDVVSVAPFSGQTLLLSLWPRAALTEQALEAALKARVHAHRFWQSALLPTGGPDMQGHAG